MRYECKLFLFIILLFSCRTILNFKQTVFLNLCHANTTIIPNLYSRRSARAAIQVLGTDDAAGAVGVAEVHRQGQPHPEDRVAAGRLPLATDRQVRHLHAGLDFKLR